MAMEKLISIVRGKSLRFLFLLLAALTTIPACSPTLQLASRWSDQPMMIDGNLAKWSDSTLFMEKDGLRFGVMNDKDYLYVCAMSAVPNLGRQLIARGMTVWFDPNGGEKKVYGVRFPIGGMRGGMMMRPEGEREAPRDIGERAPEGPRKRFDEIEQQSLQEFEFLGPGPDDRQRVLRMQGQGVEFHLTATPERFVYEMKIPLAYSSKHPYALESYAGSAIGVGFDSNPAVRPMAGESEGGGAGGGAPPEGGGSGGRGGRTGGGRGGGMRPGGMQQERANVSFNIWAHVQLADKAH
jgi:hypothetical protein